MTRAIERPSPSRAASASLEYAPDTLAVPDPADPALPTPTLAREGESVGTARLERSVSAPSVDLAREALRLQAVMHAHADLATAADALVGELARTFRAERVSIGLRARGSTRLLAASGELERVQVSGRQRALEHAMDEAIDQAAIVRWPVEPGDPPRIGALHAQYARLTQSRVTTVPLIDGERVIGALTVEHPPGEVHDPATMRDAADLTAPLGPLIELRRLAEANGLARWRLLEARRAPVQRRRRAVSWAAGAGVLLLACFPVSDRVGAPVRVEGEVQRLLVSPVDGFIGAVHARPGDAIRAGQVIAELAREELDLELDRWAAAVAQHENAYRNALVRGERAQYAASLARAAEAQAELARVQAQIERTRLVAPFDGLLIRGDLSQSLGGPVRRGEALLTVAPAGRHRVIAEIDEKDIERLRPGTTGTVVLSALPDRAFAVRVQRLSPSATSREGRTFYEVEANPDAEPLSLRPGLQGQVRFDGGRSPLAIALGRRVFDWMRLQLWSVGAWLS